MSNYYDCLITGCCFSEQDAKEVAEIITKNESDEERDAWSLCEMYDQYGARWTDEEILDYVTDGDNFNNITIEDIMKWDNVYRLSSGLIITWKY